MRIVVRRNPCKELGATTTLIPIFDAALGFKSVSVAAVAANKVQESWLHLWNRSP